MANRRFNLGGLVRPSPRRSMLTWRSPWALAAIPHGGPTSAVRFPPLSRRSIATAPASPRWRISWIASAAADLRPSSPHSPDAAPLHRRDRERELSPTRRSNEGPVPLGVAHSSPHAISPQFRPPLRHNYESAPGAPGPITHTTSGAGNWTDLRLGWTAGGGFESLLTRNWRVRAEYRFTDLGQFSRQVSLIRSSSDPVNLPNSGSLNSLSISMPHFTQSG